MDHKFSISRYTAPQTCQTVLNLQRQNIGAEISHLLCMRWAPQPPETGHV